MICYVCKKETTKRKSRTIGNNNRACKNCIATNPTAKQKVEEQRQLEFKTRSGSIKGCYNIQTMQKKTTPLKGGVSCQKSLGNEEQPDILLGRLKESKPIQFLSKAEERRYERLASAPTSSNDSFVSRGEARRYPAIKHGEFKYNVKNLTKLTPSGKYRLIIESSNMINNEEWSICTDKIIEIYSFNKLNMAKDKRFVICRPLFVEELQQGAPKETLFVDYSTLPEIVGILDWLYKLHRQLSFNCYLHGLIGKKINMSKPIAWFLAENFYDCMSGGTHQAALAACVWMCDNYDIDLSTKVYPSMKLDCDTWYTLQDFLTEYRSKVEDYLKTLNTLELKLLP